ncbi:hypothetical protein EYF80_053552 [Liparis tanakae]|nr:hypothetical protein EYF80_053552 [Liparis tanakae]
MVYSGLV